MSDQGSHYPNNIAEAWHAAPENGSERREVRRLSLIQAAGRVFGRKGFHHTTLDEIARELSVTKPMLYRYVRSKQEILYECHRVAVGMAEEALAEAERQNGTPLQRVASFAEGYIARITTTLGTCVLLTEPFSMTPEDTQRIEQHRRKIDTRLRELVKEAIDAGEIAPCDPKLAVFFFMGAINGINRWFSDTGERSGPDIARVFVDHIVASLSPQSGAG